MRELTATEKLRVALHTLLDVCLRMDAEVDAQERGERYTRARPLTDAEYKAALVLARDALGEHR